MSFRLCLFNLLEWLIREVKERFATLWILLVAGLSTIHLYAQESGKTSYAIDGLIKYQALSKINPYKPESFLIRLKSGVKKSDLKNSDVHVLKQWDDELFIVKTTPEVIERNSSMMELIGLTNDSWKLSESMRHLNDSTTYTFTVKTSDRNVFKMNLAKRDDIRILNVYEDIFLVSANMQQVIQDIIPLEEVEYVGIESLMPQEESRVTDLYLAPNAVSKVHSKYPEVDGSGTVISIRESAYDANDADLAGRHIASALTSGSVSGHATEMATIAAGAGNTFITGKGVAFNANITSSDFQELFPNNDSDYKSLDVIVQNHSYGTQIENFYGALANAYDENANRLPDLLHVFSSGNQGMDTPSEGIYKGISSMANLTGNFKMAKNALVVGAVDTLGKPLFFSSRGPAFDGRIKPELVAYSTQGSSNAAALASGVVALLQQSYKMKEGMYAPSALIKALLINSANDAGTPGVDFITGYGNIDAHDALVTLQERKYFKGTLSDGEVLTFDLHVPEGIKKIKVTLVWNDPSAPVNSHVALINDVDMKIQQGSTEWLPWVLDATPGGDRLKIPATRGTDHLNNVEQITIEDHSPGLLTIVAHGYDIPGANQDFYIVYQWERDHAFVWTSPVTGDNMPYDGETPGYFYWKSTLDQETGSLEYTIDNGNTWNVINDHVDLAKGYYRWQDTPDVNAVAQARMVTDSQLYLTELFTISRPVSVSNGFNCGDSVMIQWTHAEGADAYKVYTFEVGEMKTVTTLTDTFLILNKNKISSRRFVVEPFLTGGDAFLRTPLFDYDLLGRDCYLVSFNTQVVPEEGVYLNITLGTFYGVKEMVIEHQQGEDFVFLASLQPESRVQQFLHDQPDQGLNRYRLKVYLENGEVLISDIAEDYFLTTTPFVIFPNPVSLSGGLSVISKNFDNQDITFSLYRNDGVLVMTTKLLSDREFITFRSLSPGLYNYNITFSGRRFNGRIVLTEP